MEFGSHMQAFALLVGAMLVFLLSTVQLALGTRGLIWLIGAAMLAGSGYLMLKATGMALDHVVPAVTDAVQHADEKSWLKGVIAANHGVIRGYVVPLLDFFLVFGGLIALLALLSFTPGEGMEKLTRLLSLVLLGAVLGGLATLAAVAIGFGGYPERTAFFGRLAPDKIVDGDTFKLGFAPIRLFGVDALEDDQLCYAVGQSGLISRPCGNDAKEQFKAQTQDVLVLCARVPNAKGPGFQRDKYGRVLATCKIAEGPQKDEDLGVAMVRAGYAMAVEERYKTEETGARAQERGMWGTCTLTPEIWREDRTARANLAKAIPEWNPGDVVNAAKCPPPTGAGPAEEIGR